MNYFNVGKIVNTQGLQGEMVLSVSELCGRALLKGAELALFDEKDRLSNGNHCWSPQAQNFDIIKFKDMYIINAIENSRHSLKVQGLDPV